MANNELVVGVGCDGRTSKVGVDRVVMATAEPESATSTGLQVELGLGFWKWKKKGGDG